MVGTSTSRAICCGSSAARAGSARDAVAFAAFDGGGDHLAAERRADHVLQVADRQAVARQLLAVRLDVEVEAAGDALGEGAGGAGHGLDHGLDLLGQLFHLVRDPCRRP
jgi:hypothetical protein